MVSIPGGWVNLDMGKGPTTCPHCSAKIPRAFQVSSVDLNPNANLHVVRQFCHAC